MKRSTDLLITYKAHMHRFGYNMCVSTEPLRFAIVPSRGYLFFCGKDLPFESRWNFFFLDRRKPSRSSVEAMKKERSRDGLLQCRLLKKRWYVVLPNSIIVMVVMCVQLVKYLLLPFFFFFFSSLITIY